MDTVPNPGACDSLITLNLTVLPAVTDTVNASICPGGSYSFGGTIYTAPATVTATFAGAGGCDSVVTLILAMDGYLAGTRNITICQGQSYTFNGITYTSSNNTAMDTVPNPGACDSLITLNLTVLPAVTDTVNATICQGQAYSFNNSVYTSTQIVSATFSTGNGCDSIITLNLTVIPVNPTQETITINGCGRVEYNGTTYLTDTTILDTLYTVNGCDSLFKEVSIKIYSYPPQVQTQTISGCRSVLYNGNIYQRDTTIVDTFYSVYNCDSIYKYVEIEVEQFDLNLTLNPEDPYEGEPFTITAINYANTRFEVLSWLPLQRFGSSKQKTQRLVLNQPETIIVMAQSENGCLDTASLFVNLRAYNKSIAVPNAFTPNGDGKNDVFKPVLLIDRAYSTVEFRVFNRFGNIVHSTANINAGWDGTFNGKLLEQGVYYYQIRVIFLDGSERQFKGDVTLLR
jgi:gliding motility-associated-like protein